MSTIGNYIHVLSEEAMSKHKEILKHQGYINFIDLPDDFDHVGFLQRFGDLMPQYDGQLIWSIKSEPQFADIYHSLNNKPLFPHTECYEFEGVPPKYLALWCIKAADCGGGQTTLADGYAFISSLTEEEREKLSSYVYEFFSSAGIQKSNLGRTAHHPVLDLTSDVQEPIIRFAVTTMNDGGDPFMVDMRRRFREFFDRNHQPIFYKKNSLLLWDNWRMLHARTGFEDQTRHLKRVWLSKRPG